MKTLDKFLDIPYNGLFGDTVLARVVEEIIADPHSTYRLKDLQELTGSSAPRVRDALEVLKNLDLVRAIDGKHPLYVVNMKSKKFVALTLLSFSLLDDKKGSTCMDDAIKHYYDTRLRALYEPLSMASLQKYRTDKSSTEFRGKIEPVGQFGTHKIYAQIAGA